MAIRARLDDIGRYITVYSLCVTAIFIIRPKLMISPLNRNGRAAINVRICENSFASQQR